jgi:D-alanine-D-alanine ligase
MTNIISDRWIATFLGTVPPEQTAREIAFLCDVLPLFTHPRLLDVCCGDGRHARPLALAGYAVTAVDAHPTLIERARARWRKEDARALSDADETDPRAPAFHVQDMRALDELDDAFDGLTCLWSSFGYFDSATNDAVLATMARRVRAGGRIVLDVYHRGFFARHEGERRIERAGQTVLERKSLDGDVLTVRLSYGDGEDDVFRWQIFAPEELAGRAAACGLDPVLQCAGFDRATAPSPELPRMQLVLERHR